MTLSIKSMSYFLTAAEKGSIVQAAGELNVAASAISKAINTVEEEFALQLVQRYPAKGIVPTANGRIIMRKIRHVLDEFDTFLEEGADLQTAITGKLTIGTYAPIAPAFLPTILEPILNENPTIKFDLQECEGESAQTGLLSGAFDMIVFVAMNVRPGITSEVLTEAPPYLVIKKGHPFEDLPFVSFEQLKGEPLVLFGPPVVSDYYLGLLNEHGVDASIVATTTTTEMARSLVGAGFGSAILNMRPSTNVAYSGDTISAVPLVPEAPPLKLLLGHLGGRQRRLSTLVIDACKNYFASGKAESLTVRLQESRS